MNLLNESSTVPGTISCYWHLLVSITRKLDTSTRVGCLLLTEKIYLLDYYYRL